MDRFKMLGLLMASTSMGFGVGCGDDGGAAEVSGGEGYDDVIASGLDIGGTWALDPENEANLDCPEGVPPTTGAGAQHGDCCFRGKPNSVRLEEQGDGELVEVGYRMNFQGPGNLFETLGAQPLPTLANDRANNHEQMLLIRLEGPRENGESISGPGFSTVGSGTYNCDGTYSFYGDKPAPPVEGATYPGADDPARWKFRRVAVNIDATKDNAGRVQIPFENNYKGYSYTSFIEPNSDPFAIDWEIVTQGFTMIDFKYDADSANCLGKRDGDQWATDGSFAVYTPLKFNNDPLNDILPLGGQNFCQLVSFGILSDPDDLENLNCETTERCEPGTEGCKWKALPDSLCPLTDAEKDIFACHVGAADNIDGVEVNCTADAPTEHSDDSDGQCCTSLPDDSGLPLCNSFRLLQDIVAASANITPEPSDTALTRCPAE